MSDNEGDELVPKGNEWEVVTLTASSYSAALGPEQRVVDGDAETDHVMLMSGHFKYSTSNLENLPSELQKEESGKSDSKHEENLSIERLLSDEFAGGPSFDGKGDDISYYTSDLGDVAPSNLIEKEQSMYSTGNFGSHNNRATVDMSYMAEEGSGIAEPFESLEIYAEA